MDESTTIVDHHSVTGNSRYQPREMWMSSELAGCENPSVHTPASVHLSPGLLQRVIANRSVEGELRINTSSAECTG